MSAGQPGYSHIISVEIGDVIKQSCRCNQVATPMSTRKVAMCAVHVLGGIVQALKTGDVAGLYDALEVAITYLAGHAQRAHPERDRQTGRLQLGLEPLLESNDLIEFADAA